MRASPYMARAHTTRRQFTNRDVVDRLRAMQQEMRALNARMDAIVREQQRLALGYIRRTVTVTQTEVRRGT